MNAKHLILLLLQLSSLSCFSQVKKGLWLAGGDLSYRRERTVVDDPANTGSVAESDQTLSSFLTQLKGGYFISFKTAVGLIGNSDLTRAKNSYAPGFETAVTTNTFSLGAFAQFYLLNPEKAFNIVVEPSLQFISPTKPAPWGQQYRLAIGPMIFLTENTAVSVLPGFTRREQAEASFTRLDWMVGLQMFL